MDEQPIAQPTIQPSQAPQTSVPSTFFSKNKRVLIIISVFIILLILISTSMIIYTKYSNIIIKVPTKTTQTSSPAPTPISDIQFLSIPSKNDKILASLPQKIETGIIYFYKNNDYGGKGEISSYLDGKIANIDKQQKNLSVNEASSSAKILITTKDYIIVKSIKFSTTSKPVIKDISFDDLKVNDNVSVSSLQYNGQSYTTGVIFKKE